MTDMTGGDNGGQPTETDQLIERFGGIRPMAAKLGIPVTTVQGWKKRGHIPENRHEEILAAATRLGLTVRLTPGGGPDEDAAPAAAVPPVSALPLSDDAVSGGPVPDGDGPVPLPPAAEAAPLSAAASFARTPPREDPPFQAQPQVQPQTAAPSPGRTPAAPPVRTGRGLAALALVAALAGSGGSAVWASYRAGDFDSLLVCPSCGGFDTLAWGTAATKNNTAATARALPAPSRLRRLLSSATHLPGRRS